MPRSIYKSQEGEAEIQALYDEALDGLGLRYESLTFLDRSTRSPYGGWATIDRDIPVQRTPLNSTFMSDGGKNTSGRLWGGRFGASPAEAFERLNASIPFDIRLAPHDLRGSIAHAKMLGAQGIISDRESVTLVSGLEAVLWEVEAGEFAWDLSDEDVHTAVERRLRELVGDVALKLHTGRSRNDQVALDLHLIARDMAERIRAGVLAAMHALVEVAETNRDLILPGYTHLQRAQPILLSHHLLAHFEALRRDLRRFETARESANVSPLGAAALAGTPHPVDPSFTAAELGMDPFTNSLDAVSERDFVLDLLYACAVLGVHLSRLGEEWVLWTSAEFRFATLGDAYSSGSSIMPQKKNPDAYELMRGKTGRLIGDLNGILITLKGLPLGYSKDLQEDKEPLFDAVDSVLAMLAVLPEMLQTARFDGGRMAEAAGSFTLATELADFLAAKGIPFREAHHAVGSLVRRCEGLGVSLEDVSQDELAAAHPALSEVPDGLLTPRGSVQNKVSSGSTAPGSVDDQLRRAKAFLKTMEGPSEGQVSEGSDRCG
jgi:argininosuccinate lyase